MPAFYCYSLTLLMLNKSHTCTYRSMT